MYILKSFSILPQIIPLLQELLTKLLEAIPAMGGAFWHPRD